MEFRNGKTENFITYTDNIKKKPKKYFELKTNKNLLDNLNSRTKITTKTKRNP